MGSTVDIKAYTSTKYTIPNDGYVLISTQSSTDTSQYTVAYVNDMQVAVSVNNGVHAVTVPVFVRKGMTVRFDGTGVWANFLPLA